MHMVEFCHPARQAYEETSQALWHYFNQSWWTQWLSNATAKCHPFLILCVMRPITLPRIFLSRENPGHTPPLFVNSSYQAGKPGILAVWNPVWRIVPCGNEMLFEDQKCLQLLLRSVNERYWHICGISLSLDSHKVTYSPKSYGTPIY